MSGYDRTSASTAATPHKSRGIHIMPSSVVATLSSPKHWIMLIDAAEQCHPFNSLHTIVNFWQQARFISVEPAALNNALSRHDSNFYSEKRSCCTLTAPLQVGCHVKAREANSIGGATMSGWQHRDSCQQVHPQMSTLTTPRLPIFQQESCSWGPGEVERPAVR